MGEPTAVACYAGLGGARRAIEQMEAAGVDGDDIMMLGAAPSEAVGREVADPEITRYAGLWIALGTILGGLAGTVIGACLIGAIVLAWPGSLDHPWWAWAFGTGFVAAAGATVGGFIALARKTGFADAWEQTFTESEAVHAPRPGSEAIVHIAVFGERERVTRAIDATTPIRIEVDPHAPEHGERQAS